MDKTIEIIVVAMVAITAAMILVFMVQSESDGFLDFVDEQTSNAQDSIENQQQDSDSEDDSALRDCPEGEVPNSQGVCVSQESPGGL
jgi:uncharacterized protein YxeA